MSHETYVALSYAAAAVLIGGLVLAIWMSGRARKREMAELEAKGIRRRSSGDTDANAKHGGSAA